MIKMTVRSIQPEPPKRFNRKHTEWSSHNFEGAVIVQEKGTEVMAENFDHCLIFGDRCMVNYQLLHDNRMVTIFSSIGLYQIPTIGQTLEAEHWGTPVSVTFSELVAATTKI